MKRRHLLWHVAALIAAMISVGGVAQAAVVTMTAGDAVGTSSFDAAGKWNNLQAPSAGNDYFTGGFLIRTPTTAGDKLFAGDSLTVQGLPGNFDPANLNNALIFKYGSGYTATVNNLILDAAYIRHGEGTTTSFTLAGNLNVASRGGGFSTQGMLNIASAVSGSGSLRIAASGNNDAGRVVVFTSGLNTYTGDIELVNATQSRLRLADTGVMNFVIGASGVNNRVAGVGVTDFNGTFKLDLAGAGTTLGDTWQLVNAATLTETFGGTFSVAGAHDNGDNTWSVPANGSWYRFSETTGALTVVPEPASLSLLALAGLLMLRRRPA